MPGSVRIAIATACALALLGAVSAALWIGDATAAGGATRWLSGALHVKEGALRGAASPLYLAAIAVVPIVLRRDARKVRVAFQLALLAGITLGMMVLGFSGSAVQRRDVDAGLAAMLGVLALIGLLAWSLSRPSARVWFASGRGPG